MPRIIQHHLRTHEPPFAAITLNRPSVRNAMNFQMVDELIAAFEELARWMRCAQSSLLARKDTSARAETSTEIHGMH